MSGLPGDVLDRAPCGFASFRDDGILVAANTTLHELLGYRAGELVGRHIETILSIGGRIFYHTHFLPQLKLSGTAEEIYFSLRTKEEEDVPVLVNAARRERDGATLNDCVMMRMRLRRRYEDELLRARRAAEEATEAKARFLSMMSHDLRTPLQAIGGYADLLALDAAIRLGAEEREHLAAIKSAALEMLRLMNDILSFAQLEAGKVAVSLRPVALSEAVDRAEQLVRPLLDEARLEWRRVDSAAQALADPDRLQQILLNLLSNAIKFTPAGGRVEVACSVEDGVVRIRIADSGIGIAEDQIERVFEPFAQGESAPAGRGVGLGLSISRELTRAMGGDLTVESRPGLGSVFTVTLRLEEDAGSGGFGGV